MHTFEWDGSLCIGHAEVDRQHERFVGLAARLAQVVDSGARGEAVMRCLTELYLYANQHFRDEEALLEQMNCPESGAHAGLHRDFVRRVDAMVDRCLSTGAPYGEVLDFLHTWLRGHILGEDARILGKDARILGAGQGQP